MDQDPSAGFGSSAGLSSAFGSSAGLASVFGSSFAGLQAATAAVNLANVSTSANENSVSSEAPSFNSAAVANNLCTASTSPPAHLTALALIWNLTYVAPLTSFGDLLEAVSASL